MEILPRAAEEKTQRIKLLVTFAIEILVLIFLSTLAYFLRIGTNFPLRRTLFTPSDPSIAFSRGQGDMSMGGFDFKAYVSKDIIVILTFCLPIVIILICELMCFKRFQSNRLTIVITCFACRFSTTVRRILRFIGVFLTGILITMIFNDVTKVMVARPRPRFLEVCQFDQSACSKNSVTDLLYCDPDMACTNRDEEELAWARKSFPSFHASITSYAAFFVAFYFHKFLTRDSNLRLFGPLLSFSFVIMSLLCCLMRYCLYLNHWSDLFVGFIWGGVVAFYMTIFALNNFTEVTDFSNQKRPSLHDFGSHDLSKNKPSGHWSPWRWNENEAQNNTLPTLQTNLSTRDINNNNNNINNNNNNNNNINNNSNSINNNNNSNSNNNINNNINNNNNNTVNKNNNSNYNNNKIISGTITTTNNNNTNNNTNPFQQQTSKNSNYSFGFTDIIANETKRLNNNDNNNKYNENSNSNTTNNNFNRSTSNNNTNNNNNNNNNNNADYYNNFSLYRHKSRDNLNISDYY